MTLKGIGASMGIVMAPAFKLEHIDLVPEKTQTNIDEELIKLEDAILISEKELELIREKTRLKLDDAHAEIFNAHILVLKDPEMKGAIIEKMKTEAVSAAYALNEVSSMFISMFEAMDNEYMKERAADIKDVSKRLLSHLMGVKISDPSTIDDERIVVADDLTPSDTAQLNRDFVKGFITEIGGRTSHSAIMARSLEIPAIVGATSLMKNVNTDDFLILDGLSGKVYINPDQKTIEKYQLKLEEYNKKKEVWSKLVDEESVTLDNVEVELVANIGSPDDVEGVIRNGGEGVGLFRSEFLYMGRHDFPTEHEQFISYKTVLEQLPDKPVVVRTLDIGGDKELSYLDLPKELNPFLGYRAIRICLDQKDIFRTQLRALLRSSIYGNLKIMFPMIATVKEFIDAKAFLNEVKEELIKEGHKVSDSIEVGMMVEIPAAAILADSFAKHVDFFSIGTNDLIQYTFAADRMNENVSYLYQPYNPSLLRLIKMVIDAAHYEGKWVGMCGEMAGEPKAIPILLGLGLDEFSMSATSVLPAREIIRGLNKKECATLALKALTMDTEQDVLNLVDKFLGGNN